MCFYHVVVRGGRGVLEAALVGNAGALVGARVHLGHVSRLQKGELGVVLGAKGTDHLGVHD